MKLVPRFLQALYAALLLNSLLIFFWGDAGVTRMKALQDHRTKLLENIDELDRINAELVVERDALLYDKGAIELRARTLGYRREGETPVILPGKEAGASSRVLGTFIRRASVPGGNTATLRVLALCVLIAVFAGSFFRRQNGRSSRG